MRSPHPIVSLVVLLAITPPLGCSRGKPDVELDTPEHAASSVGRIMCAEHETRVEAVADHIDDALVLQAAKAEVVADPLEIEQANRRLQELADLFDEEEDALTECKVVLADMSVLEPDVRVRIAMTVETNDWAVDKGGDLTVEPRETDFLLTLVKIDGSWQVVESTRDFTLPGGAVGRLLE